MKTLLEKYCAAFAPSGQEDELREMIASDVAPYADELRTCLLYTSPSPRDTR